LGSKPYQNAAWFRQKHVVEGWSIRKMSRKCEVDWRTIQRWGRKHGIPIKKQFEVGKQYPNLGPSPDLAYLLGVIAGDGCVSGYNRIYLGTKDYEFAQEFRRALKAIGLRANVIKRNTWNKGLKRQEHGWQCQAHSTVFVDWYNGLAQEQEEGIARQFPKEYLKGFFESEGTCIVDTRGSANVRFSNLDYELLLMVQRLLTLLGYESRIYESKYKEPFKGREVAEYKLNLLGSSEEKHGFIKRLNPCIKNRPYDYSDPNGLRGRKS